MRAPNKNEWLKFFKQQNAEWITCTRDGKPVILPFAPEHVWDDYFRKVANCFRPTREEVTAILDSFGYVKRKRLYYGRKKGGKLR